MTRLVVHRSLRTIVASLLTFSLSTPVFAGQPPSETADPAPEASEGSDASGTPEAPQAQDVEPTSAAPAEPSKPAAQALDIVRLTNGGMLRGTIAEHIPGEYVIIVLVTGESRRLEAAEFSYAGPAQTDASSTAADGKHVEMEGGDTWIRFEAAPDSPSTAIVLNLRTPLRNNGSHAQSGDDLYASTPVCTSPCSAKIPGGEQAFALAADKRPAQVVTKLFKIHADDTLIGFYENRKWTRIAGAIVLGVALSAGVPLLAYGVKTANEEKKALEVLEENEELDGYTKPGLTTGAKIKIASGVILGIGAAVSIGLMAQKDRVRLTIKPKVAMAK